MKSVFEQQNNYKKTYYIRWEHQDSRSFKQNSYVIVRIKPTRLNPMKFLVGFANIPVHKNTNYRLTFLSRSTALPNVHATTINNWNMVAGRLDINAWDKLSGFL